MSEHCVPQIRIVDGGCVIECQCGWRSKIHDLGATVRAERPDRSVGQGRTREQLHEGPVLLTTGDV